MTVGTAEGPGPVPPWPCTLAELKVWAVYRALVDHEGCLKKAAAQLHIPYRSFRRYIKALRVAASKPSGVQPPAQPVQVPVFGSGRLTQAPEWEYQVPSRAWLDGP